MKKITITIKKGSSRQDIEREIWEQVTEIMGLDAERYPLMRRDSIEQEYEISYEEDRIPTEPPPFQPSLHEQRIVNRAGTKVYKKHEVPSVENDYEINRREIELYKKKNFLSTFFPHLQNFLERYELGAYFEDMKSRFETELYKEDVTFDNGFINAAVIPNFLSYLNKQLDITFVDWENKLLAEYKAVINHVLGRWLGSLIQIEVPVINELPNKDYVDIVDEKLAEGYSPGVIINIKQLSIVKQGSVIKASSTNVISKGKVVIVAEASHVEEPKETGVDVLAETEHEMEAFVEEEIVRARRFANEILDDAMKLVSDHVADPDLKEYVEGSLDVGLENFMGAAVILKKDLTENYVLIVFAPYKARFSTFTNLKHALGDLIEIEGQPSNLQSEWKYFLPGYLILTKIYWEYYLKNKSLGYWILYGYADEKTRTKTIVYAETQPEMAAVGSQGDSPEKFVLLGIQQLQTLLSEYGLEEFFDEVSNKFKLYFRYLFDASIDPDIALGNALIHPQLYRKLFARNKSDAEKINNFLKSFLEIITTAFKMLSPHEITGYYLFPKLGIRFNAKRDYLIETVGGTQFNNGEVVAITGPAKYDNNGDVERQAQVKIAR